MNIAQYAIKHKAVLYLTLFLVGAGGMVAYNNLGKLEDPEFIIKTAIIVTPYPGASPYEVEQQVTEVIERAAQSADEVESIHSISRAGVSLVYVNLLEHNHAKQIQQLWDMLRRKVVAVQGELPDGAGPSQVYDDFGDVYGIFLALTGDGFSNAELKKYADFIQRELLLVRDVSRIQVFGTRTECVNVDFSAAKIATLGIHPNQILGALQSQNMVVYPGAVQTADRRIRVEYPGDFQSVEEIGGLVIAGRGMGKIMLRDIATISRGYVTPPEPTMRFNGEPSVGIAISATSRANVVTMGDAVQARLDELFQDLPMGLEIEGVYYQSEFVKGAIRKFITNLLQSVAIVIGVLVIVMGIRSGLLIASGLVLSILGTLLVMLVWGIDLHRISLASLILVMGMIVDNAIVVTDGSLVRLKLGQKRNDAVVRPAVRTAWPLLGATMIACLAFLPIFLSPNNSGEYCRSLFQVVSIALLISWLLSMSQTPVFCAKFLKISKRDGPVDPFASAPYRIYTNALQWFLRHRLFSVSLMIGLCVFAGYGMQKVPKMFFADSDKAQFFIDYWMPEGTRIEQTSDDLRLVERHLSSLPEVKSFATVIGSGPPRFVSNLTPESRNPAYGQIIVNVHDYRIIPSLQEKLDVWFIENQPDAAPKMRSYISGPPADYKVEARFSGPDPAVLRDLAEQTKTIMRAEPAAKYVRDDWRQRVALWEPVYSQQQAREAGVERKDVAISILRATDGLPVATYREGDELIPVLVRSLAEDGAGIPSPDATPVWGSGPASVPLGQVVSHSEISWEDPTVRRYNRRRSITVQCDTAGMTSDTLLARVRPQIEGVPMPVGYTLDWAGEHELMTKGNAGVQKFLPLALTMMFFILVALFNGFRQPIIIVLVVPLALTGMVAGLLFTGQPFGFLALLGAYSLIGMLIKNAVVLIDQIEFAIRDGKAPYEAVVTSSVSRLRPVTMASATTIFGMVPLLKDAMFASMAVTIMFGLALATVLTLIVVPVLYTLFFRIPTGRPPDRENKKRNLKIILVCCFLTAAPLGSARASEKAPAGMTVDQAIKEALTANPVIRQSRSNESAAKFGVESAKKDLLPKASITYRYTGLGEDPVMKTALGDQPIAHRNQFHWEVAIVQPLFSGYARVLGLEMARLQEAYTKEQTRKSILDVILDVKTACYKMLLAQKVLSVTEEEVRALEAHTKDARLFYEQGLIPGNDLLKSRVALAAALQRAERIRAGVEVAASALSTLLNRDQDNAVVLADIVVTPEKAPALEPLYAQALSNRPVLALLKNATKRLEIEEKLVRSPRYPHVNLVGSYSRDGDGPSASENDFSNSHNTAVMLEAKWIFFQWDKTRSDVARVRQEKRAVLHQIENMENQIRLQVKSAVLDLEVARKNIRTAETALAQARENYRITDLQYRQQVVNSSEVLDARVYLTEAEKNYHEAAVYGYLNALAWLDRAVGQGSGNDK